MRRLLVGLAFVLVACSEGTSTAPLRYRTSVTSTSTAVYPFVPGVRIATIPGLDPTSGSLYTVYAINDWGEFVGFQAPNLPKLLGLNPMKYQTTRGLTVLPSALMPPPNFEGHAVSVNDSGQVLVWNNAEFGDGWSATIWNWFGKLHQLRNVSASDGSWCVPYVINNHGVVAGTCLDGFAGVQLATVWTPSGTPWAIRVNGNGAFVEQVHIGVGLSDSEYITGQLSNGTGFLFTPTQQLHVLPEYVKNGVSYTVFPQFVNNLGQAAGFAATGGADPAHCWDHAVAWLTPSTITDLGFCGDVKGITDDGIVAATLAPSATSTVDTRYAVIWTAKNGIQRLPGLDTGTTQVADTSIVDALNHKHQIVGVQYKSDGSAHTVVWTLPATF